MLAIPFAPPAPPLTCRRGSGTPHIAHAPGLAALQCTRAESAWGGRGTCRCPALAAGSSSGAAPAASSAAAPSAGSRRPAPRPPVGTVGSGLGGVESQSAVQVHYAIAGCCAEQVCSRNCTPRDVLRALEKQSRPNRRLMRLSLAAWSSSVPSWPAQWGSGQHTAGGGRMAGVAGHRGEKGGGRAGAAAGAALQHRRCGRGVGASLPHASPLPSRRLEAGTTAKRGAGGPPQPQAAAPPASSAQTRACRSAARMWECVRRAKSCLQCRGREFRPLTGLAGALRAAQCFDQCIETIASLRRPLGAALRAPPPCCAAFAVVPQLTRIRCTVHPSFSAPRHVQARRGLNGPTPDSRLSVNFGRSWAPPSPPHSSRAGTATHPARRAPHPRGG